MRYIWSCSSEVNGWVTINGVMGVKRYLYYSIREARRRYCKEARELFNN